MTLQTLPAACGWHLFKIEGQLDFAAAPMIQAALLHAAEMDSGRLLIDLEDLKTADEVGVNALSFAVRKLLSEQPGMHVAFIARDAWLAEELRKAEYPAMVSVYRNGSEAMDAITLHEAA